MLHQRVVETVVGFFILIGILAFVFLALKVSGLTTFRHGNEYVVYASFNNVGDLKPRAPITIAGVKVGYVGKINLDSKTFQADVQLVLNTNVDDLPVDTSASILTAGLLGSNYISLEPGYQDKMLKNGGHLRDTHSALILENLIGQFLYKTGKEGAQ